MADRIKGLTIVLGADASELTKAIYNINSDIGKTRTNLRELNGALKFDPTNVNLLRDKQDELTRAIQQTQEKIDAEKEALQKLEDSGVDKTSQQFRDLQTQIDLDESALKGLEKQMQNFGSVGSQVAQAVGAQMKEVGSKIKEVGDKIANVGTGLTTTVTLPIVAAGTKAVSSFAEVDKTMQLTNATMGNTEEQADLINKAMEQAAANSTFGMSDAAQATLNFARAGLTAEQAADALAPAMNLAAGEAGDLDTVSAGLTATINGFGDDFSQAEKYADVFAAACNNSALDVNSLSEAMSVAAPIFSTAGKNVEDAALYMGVMANAGIEANVAANSLKTGMARLAQPTKQAKQAMDDYGIAMSDIWNPDGSMKDTVTIQKNLHDSFAKLSEQEQMAAAGAIFGKNQMAPWLALINTAPESVDALNESLRNSTGTTTEMAEAMMSGFGGSIEKLKSSLDVLITSLGSIIAEYLTPFIEKIQGVIDKFLALDDETKQHIVQIVAIIAAIGPVLLIIGKVVSAIGTVVSVIGSITSAIGVIMPIITGIGTLITGTIIPAIAAVGAPVLAIIAVIGLLVAGIVTVIQHWDEIKEKTKEVVEDMQEKWTKFKDNVSDNWNKLKDKTAETAKSIGDKWSNFKTDTSQKWKQTQDEVTKAAGAILRITVQEFSKLKTDAVDKVNQLKNDAANVFSNLQASISNTVSNIKGSIVDGFQNAISYITSLPSQAVGWGRDIINGVVDGIYNAFHNLVSAVADIAETIADYIGFSEPDKGALSNFHTFMPDMMRLLAQGIESNLPTLENAMDNMTRSMVPVAGNAGLTGNNTTNNNSNTVSVNVYGAQGQDVNELAQIIEDKITNNVVRRGVAFG